MKSNAQLVWDERAILEDLKRDVFLSLKSCDIATIKSVDFSKNTVSAEINYRKTILVPNDSTSGRSGKANPTYVPKQVAYPILLDVPMISLYGGDSGVTFPVQVGDQCLVIYNDRSIDSWFKDKNQKTLSSNRMHSISDGFALVGVRSVNDAVQWISDGVRLYKGSTELVLKDKVSIKNSSQSLSDVLQELIQKVNQLSTTCAAITVSGTPIQNAAAFTALATEITQVGTKLADLLE